MFGKNLKLVENLEKDLTQNNRQKVKSQKASHQAHRGKGQGSNDLLPNSRPAKTNQYRGKAQSTPGVSNLGLVLILNLTL